MGNKQGKNGGCHDGRRGAVFNYFGQFAPLVENLPPSARLIGTKGVPTLFGFIRERKIPKPDYRITKHKGQLLDNTGTVIGNFRDGLPLVLGVVQNPSLHQLRCNDEFDQNSTMGNTVKPWRNDQNRNRAEVGKCTRLPTIYNRTSFDDSCSLVNGIGSV